MLEIEVTSDDVNDYLETTEKAVEVYLEGMQEIEGLQDLIQLNADLVENFANAYDILICANVPKH